MDNSALKNKIIKSIGEITDPEVLAYLAKVIELENSNKVYYLSDHEKQLVQEGQEAYKRGDVLSEDEANKDIDEWLNK